MKYKGFLLATAGGVAAASGAQAADLPVKAPQLKSSPAASWEGFHLGVNAGIAWQRATAEYAAGGNFIVGRRASFIGGGQIGYNWQSGNYVYGLEADISGLSKGPTVPGTKGNALEANINWLSTLRGRAGWLVSSDTLVYATGGLAVGGVKNTFAPDGLLSSQSSITKKSVSKTAVGWTVGGGLENKLSQNWTIGFEGLYVDLGKTTGTGSVSSKVGKFSNTAAIGRLKLNYNF